MLPKSSSSSSSLLSQVATLSSALQAPRSNLPPLLQSHLFLCILFSISSPALLPHCFISMDAAAGPHELSDPPGTLFFQGSISEAIVRAQAENLVLVVFVAGENEESVSLELTTFQNPAVLDEVKKQSLFLRLQEGSTDANYFSAIFPVRHVPTITLIGYKGSLLQQLEGYQEAEPFLTALRHAVTTFNTEVQRAVASAMVAFLSTAKNITASGTASAPEPQSSDKSTVEDTQVASSSSTATPSAASVPAESLPSKSEETPMDVDLQAPAEVTETRLSPDSKPSTVESGDRGGNIETGINESVSTPEASRSSLQNSKPVQKQTSTTGVKQGSGKKAPLQREPPAPKPVRVRTGPFPLQVRLTNGETIQGSFESYQLLRDVKNFVDLQRTDGNMEFQLAVPFPRKVFTEGDMDTTLTKLGLGPRSALILVGRGNSTVNPSHPARALANNAADTSSQGESTTADGSYLGKFLSYLSPYVYGKPTAASRDQTSSASSSQNDASPTTSRALRQGSQPSLVNSSAPELPFETPFNGGSKQENSTQAGRLSQRRGGSGNVHTLRKDDEGAPTGNTYWNGNSTQFGGNDEAKED